MDFAAMKRRELQALCKRHGLAGGGSNADLSARLAATLSGRGSAEEQAVGVVAGKGRLKRSAGGASGGGSDAAKKVTFVLEEEAEAEAGVRGRRRGRPQVMWSPVAAKTRGRRKAGETLAGVDVGRGERRRMRSQVGGDSAGEGDAGEAGADAPVRRSRRNSVNLGAGDGVEKVVGALHQNNFAKVEEKEEDMGEAVDRKRKRNTRENLVEDVRVSEQVGVSRRSTWSSGLLLGPAAVSSPVVEKKRGRRKAGDVKEKTCVEEQPAEVQHLGRTLRSGLVVVGPVSPMVAASKRSRRKVQEEEPALEKVAKVEISGRATRSSLVAADATSPSVVEKRRRRKTEDVRSDRKPPTVLEVPINDAPVTRVLRNRAVQVNGGVVEGTHIGKKMENKRQPSKASAIEMQIKVLEPVGRSRRKSVVPSFLEHGTKGVHEDVKQQTVKEPVRRSTRKYVVPAILEKERKGLTTETIPETHVWRLTRRSMVPAMLEKGRMGPSTEMIPEAHVRRSMRKSALPMFNNENNNHDEIVRSEIFPSAKGEEVEKQPTVKQPVRRITRNSAVPAMLEKERKGIPAEMNPDAHVTVRRSMRKSIVPNMLNNENNDHPEMQSAKDGDVEKQLGVEEPVRRLTRKSVVPAVFEKENKGLHEEMKSGVSVRKSVCNSVVPIAVDKENKDHSEMVRREESRVQTRNSRTRLQYAVQNDESLQRTCNSSKLVISPLQSKPTASKGRPAKRRRTVAFQEVMPVEEHKEDQTAYGAHTSDWIEVAIGKGLESAVLPFPAEDKSNLQDAQLNSKLEGTSVVESGLSCDKDISNILEFGSSVNSVGKRTPSNSSLPDSSSMAHYQQEELSNDLLVDEYPEESATCLKNSDLGAGGTTEESPYDLAIPDCEHVGALSEEAVHSMDNDAGRCSPNLEQSPTGLHFLFSEGITEGSDTHNAIPSSENRVEESDVHKVECLVETIASSEPDSYQGSHEDLSRVEENGGCMFSSQQNNKQEGFSKSSHAEDWVAPAQLDLSNDVNHIVREIITEDMIYKEKEENEFVPSSDIVAPHEKSHANEPAGPVSGVSEALFCNSQSSPTFDEVNLNSDSSQLESLDALDNQIAFSNTEVLHQDNKKECNIQNEGRVTQGIDANGISEAAPREGSKIGKRLLPAVETPALPDEQLNSKLDGDEFEEHTCSCGKDSLDTSGAGSVKNNISHLAKECITDSCQEQELKLPNDLSAPKSHEESSICQYESVIGSGMYETIGRRCTDEISTMDHEGCNEHHEDQVTPDTLASRMSEPALIEGSESGMTLLAAAETSVLPDEQLSTKLEDNEEHSLSCDKDTSYISDTGPVGNNILSSLKDSYMDPCHDQELLNDMPAPKSPEESAVCMEDSVSGSVGICQTSGRRRVDEICTKLLSFKISSTVKGSNIAMDAPCSTKQGDNLGQCAIALLRNMDNTPTAKTDLLKLSTDSSVSKDSSTQVLQSISGKPRDVGLAVDNPDNKLDMEQVQQYDVQVQEGTVEKTALDSATPECKHECGLLDEAEPHSMKNEGCASSVEQSPFGLQSLFSQESIEEPIEYGAFSLAGVQAENGIGESKDYHVEYRVEKTPLTEPVSDHETRVDFRVVSKNGDCVYTSLQDNEKEGLTKASHEQGQVASGQLDFLEVANCMKEDTNSEKVAYEDEESKMPAHSTYINSRCEKLDANGPVEHASGISDALFSSSLIAATDDNDKVHLNSNMYQLESTDFLDEPIGCSNTEVLQQGLKEQFNKHKEDQVAYGACTGDMIETDTAKDLESGVSPLPAEERSNLRDEQLSSKLEATEVVESGLSCDKDVSNILEFGSAVNSNGERTPSDTSSLKGFSMDHYLQQELLNDFSVQTSPKESDMCWENSAPGAVSATIEKPSFDLANPDCKHDAERCSPDLKQSPIGLQFLFSQETIYGSDTHGALVLPSAENLDDSNTCHVDMVVEKVVSSEPYLHQGSHEDLTRVEENGGCMFSSQLDDEQEGFSKCSHKKDWVASAQLDSSEDVNPIERVTITEEVICRAEENRKFISFSDIGTDHEKSHASESAEHASGVSEPSFYHKEECNEHRDDQVTPGVDASGMSEAAPVEGSESGKMLLSAAETSALPNEQLLMLLPAAAMSALPDEQLITLLPAVEMSALPDDQPNPELEGDEFEENNLACDKAASDICGAGSGKNNTSHLLKDCHMDSIQEQELPDDLCAPNSPKESAICQGEGVLGSGICHTIGWQFTYEISTKLKQDHNKECNEHNEDQVPPGILASGMSGPAPIEGTESEMALFPIAETSALPGGQLHPELEGDEFEEYNRSCDKETSYICGAGSVNNNMSSQYHEEEYTGHNQDQVTPGILANGKSGPELIDGSESVMTLLPAAGASALPDEQFNPKLEGNEEHSLGFDKDTSNISDTRLVENNNPSSLPKDACSEIHHEQKHSVDMPAPNSPEESAICPGICQNSERRCTDEISTNLLTFKISSTVKESYIATDAPSSKQGDNQSQSAIALLRNRENAPAAKTGHPPKPKTDRSSAKNSSRRALQTISGVLRDL